MADIVEQDLASEAFWELTDEQIELLRSHGEVRKTSAGQTLFRQGDATCDFFVVLDGEVELVEPTGQRAAADRQPAAERDRRRAEPADRRIDLPDRGRARSRERCWRSRPTS